MIMASRDGQLTVQQASETLGVTDGYLRRLLGRGELQGTKFGAQWCIASSDIERLRATIGRRSKRAKEVAARQSKPRRR